MDRAGCPGKEMGNPKVDPLTQTPQPSKSSFLSGATGFPHRNSAFQNCTQGIGHPQNSVWISRFPLSNPKSQGLTTKVCFLLMLYVYGGHMRGCCSHVTLILLTLGPRLKEAAFLEHHSDFERVWHRHCFSLLVAFLLTLSLDRTIPTACPAPEPGTEIPPGAGKGAGHTGEHYEESPPIRPFLCTQVNGDPTCLTHEPARTQIISLTSKSREKSARAGV